MFLLYTFSSIFYTLILRKLYIILLVQISQSINILSFIRFVKVFQIMYDVFYTCSPIKIIGDDMNDRKQHVINKAHQLFINKGVQATSVQDILEYSGISKGTFYNYFSSKNELLISIFTTLYKKLAKEGNELLIGQDPSNMEVFIKQIELHIKMNRMNKSISIFEEIVASNDEELKHFIKQGQLRILRWIYERFIDLFGESKKHCLLDCSIMFLGILHHNVKYNGFAYQSNANTHEVVRYSVNRVIKMVNEVAETGDQLIDPKILDKWLPNCSRNGQSIQSKIGHTVLVIKKALASNAEQEKYIELLDFVSEELLHSRNPRKFLVGNILSSLKSDQAFLATKELQELDQLITDYLKVMSQ